MTDRERLDKISILLGMFISIRQLQLTSDHDGKSEKMRNMLKEAVSLTVELIDSYTQQLVNEVHHKHPLTNPDDTCTREPNHEGPCTGFPRESCPGYENWRKGLYSSAQLDR